MNTSSLAPFAICLGCSIPGYMFVCPGVVGLLLFGSPSAIGWCVIAIIIYSVNAMVFGRSATHVRKEIDISFSTGPSRAYFYSPVVIIISSIVIRIVAAGVHRLPYPVFSRLVSFAMNKRLFGRMFFPEATARLGSSGPEFMPFDFNPIAAIAFSYPISFRRSFASLDDSNPVVFSSNHVDYFRHKLT